MFWVRTARPVPALTAKLRWLKVAWVYVAPDDADRKCTSYIHLYLHQEMTIKTEIEKNENKKNIQYDYWRQGCARSHSSPLRTLQIATCETAIAISNIVIWSKNSPDNWSFQPTIRRSLFYQKRHVAERVVLSAVKELSIRSFIDSQPAKRTQNTEQPEWCVADRRTYWRLYCGCKHVTTVSQ